MNMKNILVLILLVSLSLLFSHEFEEHGGVRNAAMGETGISNSTDVSGAQWNPALISNLKHYQFVTDLRQSSVQLDNDDIYHNFLFLGIPVEKIGTFSLSGGLFNSDEYENAELNLNYGRKIGDKWAVGLTLVNYYVNYSGVSESTTAMDFGLGALYHPTEYFTLGLSTRNLLRPDVAVDSRNEDKLPMLAGIGATFHANNLIITTDFEYQDKLNTDDEIRLGLGAEYSIYDNLALRTGINNNFLTAGFGVKMYTKNWFANPDRTNELYNVNTATISLDYSARFPIFFSGGNDLISFENEAETEYGDHFIGITVDFGTDRVNKSQLAYYFPEKYGRKFGIADTVYIKEVVRDTIYQDRTIIDTVAVYEKIVDQELLQERLEEQLEIVKVKEYDNINRASVDHLVNALRYYYNAEYKKSIAECEKSIDIAPRLSLSYIILGSIYYKMGDSELAFDYWEKAKKVYSKNEELNKVLENIYNGIEDFIPQY